MNSMKFRLSILFILFLSVRYAIGQIDTSDVNRLFEMSFDELLDQQVTTAAKYEQISSEAASSITVINSEDIEKFGYYTFDEAIMSQQGFYISNDKNYVYLGNRGFSRPTDYNNRILLLENGHTFNENVYGSALIGSELSLNMNRIKQIEIVRGPGSALYGTGAMLNVINIIPKSGSDINGISIQTRYGSFNKREGTVLFGKHFNNSLDIVFSALGSITDGDDYFIEELDGSDTNNGMAENMDWENLYGLRTRISIQGFELSGTYTTRNKGIPTGAWDSDITGDTRSNDTRFYLELKYHRELFKNQEILCRTYFDGYSYEGIYPSMGINSYDASDGRWYGAEIQYYWQIPDRNKLTGGIEIQNNIQADYRQWDNDTVYYDSNFPFSIISFYVQDEYKIIHNLSITGGLRFDNYSNFDNAVTPRMGLIFEPFKTSTLKLLYGEAFRAPNVYESSYESEGYNKANPNIEPERIQTTEMVWKQKLGKHLSGLLSVYHYTMKDLIDQELDLTDSLIQFQNKSRVNGKGIEAGITIHLNKNVRGYVNLMLQKTIDETTDEKLTNSPEFIFKAGWIQSVYNYVFIAPEFRYETERITVYDSKTKPIFLTDLTVSSATFMKYFSLSVKIRNLFDQEYGYPGGYEHIQAVIPQNGRSFICQLSLNF